jgi:hypothetical protein
MCRLHMWLSRLSTGPSTSPTILFVALLAGSFLSLCRFRHHIKGIAVRASLIIGRAWIEDRGRIRGRTTVFTLDPPRGGRVHPRLGICADRSRYRRTAGPSAVSIQR